LQAKWAELVTSKVQALRDGGAQVRCEIPALAKSTPRTEKIIEASAKLFARQGYHATSTRQIAQLAGVGENTLFRHFDHKEELFWSTLRHYSSGLKLRRDLEEGLAQCRPPEIVLPKIIEQLNDTASYKPELLRMIAVAFLELHWNVGVYHNEYLAPVIEQIRRYLEMNIRDGKLRGLDPTILTTALMMATLMYPGIPGLVNPHLPLCRTNPDSARKHTEFWMDLLA
jgi:AcrR family transcriptional regulator